MPSYTTEKTWTNETIEADELNTYLRDNVEYLKAVVDAQGFSGCRLTRATDQAIADGAVTDVSWTAETIDQGGWFPGSGATITVPAGALPPGYTSILVDFRAQIYWDSSSVGSRNVYLLKNGVEIAHEKIIPAFTGTFSMSIAAPIVNAVPGDTFTVQVGQSSGGSLNLAGATVPLTCSLHRAGYY